MKQLLAQNNLVLYGILTNMYSMWCISFVVWEHDQKRNINIVLRNELYYNYIGERERESERERERDLLLLLDGTIGLYTCK